jgi:hypothetical protein
VSVAGRVGRRLVHTHLAAAGTDERVKSGLYSATNEGMVNVLVTEEVDYVQLGRVWRVVDLTLLHSLHFIFSLQHV